MDNEFTKGILTGCLTFLLPAAAIAIRGLIVYLIWNAMMPEIFNLPELNYWHATGLVFMVSFVGKPLTPFKINDEDQ